MQGFKDKFTSIGNTVGSIAGKISSFVKNIAGIFKKEFAGSIGEGADAAGGAFETIVGGAVAAFDTIVTAVDKGLKAFNAILEFFGGAFTGNWDSAAQSFRNSIKNIFPPDIAAGIINVFNTLLPGIKAVVSGIKATFTGLVQDVKKIFDGFTTIFKGIGTMLGANSKAWKAILQDGSLVAPGTNGTLKFDYTGNPANATSGFHITTTVEHKQTDDGAGYGAKDFGTLTAKSGVTIPDILKALALFPNTDKTGRGFIYFRNNGERLLFRGGAYGTGGYAGEAYGNFFNPRSVSYVNVGLFSAYVDPALYA